ncbi:MAG: restriction endonuclease subunit M [Methanobrevibacter sp. CfCl-M3]
MKPIKSPAEEVDVKENRLLRLDVELLEILISDNSSGRNIIWAVDDYKKYGKGYSSRDVITTDKITGKNGEIIKPRIKKTQAEQKRRVQEKAEVFTPNHICNKMNSLVDKKLDKSDWQNYVRKTWLEMACGEAPYIVSRYDTTTGKTIEISKRIGFLDRKLQVINKNIEKTADEAQWLKWVKIAFQNSYGFEWQGDNLIIARENLLYTFIDYYKDRFKAEPSIELLREFAEIIAWNIFQADGLKGVVPMSCTDKVIYERNLVGETITEPCPGCKTGDNKKHTGVYVKLMDWETGETTRLVDLKGGK